MPVQTIEEATEAFKAKLKKLRGIDPSKVQVRTRDFFQFFYTLPDVSLVSFRPDSSAYFSIERKFNEIIVFDSRFARSPWPAAFLIKGDGPCYMNHADLELDIKFFPQALKIAASAAFEEMKSQDATKFDHGKFKNSDAVLQAGRGDMERQVVKTPADLYEIFNRVFNFDFDPCPIFPPEDAMKCRWNSKTCCYVNPPFKHTGAFAWRAAEQADLYGVKTVLICPALTHAKWRTQLVLTGNVHAYIFLRNGIKFEGYDKKMPLPLSLILIGPKRQGGDPRKIPVFFWDPCKEMCTRRMPSLSEDNMEMLKNIGW